MIASPALVIGCFWLGWSGNYAAVPWYVPALSTILIGFAISLIFMSFLAYIVDTYLMLVVPLPNLLYLITDEHHSGTPLPLSPPTRPSDLP
jgi:hypothetical protein